MSEPGILPEPVPFGKYYLLERINVGGMAEVYKAKAFGVEGFERLLAIKKILDNIAEDESFIEMFIDEAKIAGQLNHPNIAQIFDLGQVDGSYFIALEYISGKDLKTQFERARRIGEEVSIPRICYTIMKVCEGLGHAHEKTDPQGNDLNIVHRDVSPQNILVSYEGEVKIIDFGIAKAQGKTSQTQVGILKGKFSYMSPEQVRGLHVDHRSDIFSLGIVLYEMLTLERLFLGESDFDTLEKIRKVEMSPPSLYNPHIPKQLEDIVLKALARTPEDRYQSAYELAEDLERFMRDEGYYYTNKDLASYMKDAFEADIEFEQKKLEYYRSLDLEPLNEPDTSGDDAPEGDLAWGEDEMETEIYTADEEDGAGAEPDVEAGQEISDEDIVFADELEEDDEDIVYADDAEPVVGDGAGDDEVTQIHVPGAETGGAEPVVDDQTSGGPPEPDDQPPTTEFDRFDDAPDLQAGEPDSDIEVEPRRDPQPTARVKAVEEGEDAPEGVEVPRSTRREPTQSTKSFGGRALRIGLAAGVVVAAGLGVVFGTDVLEDEEPAEVTFEFGDDPVQITVDGETIHDGETPVERQFPPGDVDLEVRREGYQPIEKTATLEAGEAVAIDDQLEPLDYSDTGLDIEVSPEEATVWLDDEQLEDGSPAQIRDLEPSTYEVRVELEDFLEQTREVELEHDEIADLEVELRPAVVDLQITSSPDHSEYTVYDEETGERIASGRTSALVEDLDAETTYRVTVDRDFYHSAETIVEPDGERELETHVSLDQDETALADRRGTASPDDGQQDEDVGGTDPDPGGADPDPEPEPEPAGTGTVAIQSNPAARIYINGEDTGQYTPVRGHELPVGRHQIRLVNEDQGLDTTKTVHVEDGEMARVIHR